MKFTVITLMPELVRSAFQNGLVGQALGKGLIVLDTLNPREFGEGTHRAIDDRVFGGSDGMLMQPEPLANCVDQILGREGKKPRLIHLSPRGRVFDDALAREMANSGNDIVLVASRYAGVDQRWIDEYQVEEISIGDYVLSGGELPACIVIEAVARHLPGVLGNSVSSQKDSFHDGLLEGPQYTRPQSWRNREVPSILLCGDQKLVSDYERLQSLKVTIQVRRDLLEKFGLERARGLIAEVIKKTKGISREPGVSSVRKQAAAELEVFAGKLDELIENSFPDQRVDR